MRSLAVRVFAFLVILAVPFAVQAHDVTISGAVQFGWLDGSSDDHDGAVNGTFAVDGDLTINGTITCNDDSGRESACAMAFNVGRDLTINAGAGLFAENRTGSGQGAPITLTVGRHLVVRGPAGAVSGALISTNSQSSSGSTGGGITANVAGALTVEAGATLDAGSSNAAAGKIILTSAGSSTIDGNVLSGPSRNLLATRLTDAALSGGTANQVGGEIRIKASSFAEPGLTIGTNASIVSQGDANGAGPITIEGCGVVIKGLVAALGRKDSAARISIRSGKDILIDARDLGVAGATLGRVARVRADAPAGTATAKRITIVAAETIEILGPEAASSALFVLTSHPGLHDAKSIGGTIRITSLGDVVTASGNLIDSGRTSSGDTGGTVAISAKGNVTLDRGTIRTVGDSTTNNPVRGGGSVSVRSHSGAVSWTNGAGDVRPAGSSSGLPSADQGTIAITACGAVTTSGTSFPTNGPAVGPWPAQQTGVCSPAAPPLPVDEAPLLACNTPPVANAQTASTNEDTAVTLTLTGSDADGDALTFSIVTAPAHGSLGAFFNATPASVQVVYTPSANYNGADTFSFAVADGKGGSDDAVVTLAIAAVNDPPSFTSGGAVTASEDSGAYSAAWATAISAGPPDENSQSVSFSITGNSNSALFSAQPSVSASGLLTFTAAADMYGAATITIRASDNGGTANGGVDTSASQTFTVTITPVNDVPSFAVGVNQTANEDAGAQTVSGWASAITAGPANESSQAVDFIITANSNPSLFSVAPAVSASGTLTYTTALNANGSATISLAIHDDGGTTSGGVDTSAAQTFTITVTAVNDPPSFTSGGNVSVLEDSSAYSAAWASGISSGPADESGQTVTFSITANSNSALFSVQPAVSGSGVLSFTAAADAHGSATITVRASDDGGGADTSAPQTFTITLTPVNDAPSFTSGGDVAVAEDAAAYSAPWAGSISAGPNEAGQTLNFVVSNNNNALFSLQPSISAAGVLTFTSAPNANGAVTVTVALHDDGGTANGGIDTSAAQTFTITVSAVNDPPSFTGGGDVSALEDSGSYSAPWATNISPGSSNESGQSVSFVITSNSNSALFSVQPAVSASGVLTFTPAANFHGTATITIEARDSENEPSAAQTFTITIVQVNDAPSFTSGGNVTSLEDAGPSSSAWATAVSSGPNDPSQALNFIVSNDNNALFSTQPAISASGVLTFTAAANANGSATVTVALHDDGGIANGGVDTSASQTFTITIVAVNDAPSFTGGGNVSVLEDSGAYSASWVASVSAGPSDESGQTFTYSVTGNSNNAIFSVQPQVSSSGVLTFTTATDAFGSSTITIVVTDNGGTANGGSDTSAAQTFSITIHGVNDAPSFTKGANVSANDNAGPQTVSPWATSISAGPGETQAVNFVITGNSNPSIFASSPAVSASGALTFTPANPSSGTASITLVLHDDGGTANGGSDTSASQSFNITVNHANSAPVAGNDSYDTIGNTLLQVGPSATISPAVHVNGNLLANDTDADGGPSPLTASLGSATTGAQVTVNADGTFTYVPPAGVSGSDTFTYTVSDGASTATATVTITIKSRVWYVRNTAPAMDAADRAVRTGTADTQRETTGSSTASSSGTGTGVSNDPFTVLVDAESASVAGDTIYVFVGEGSIVGQNAGIALKNHQRLIGEGVALVMDYALNGNPAPATLRAAGSMPHIGNILGVGVTIANVTGVTVRGLDISGSTNAVSISTTGVTSGGATVSDNVISASGAEGVKVRGGSTGSLAVSFFGNALITTGNGFDARATAGMMSLGVGSNTVRSAANGIHIEGAGGAVTVANLAANFIHEDTVGDGITVLNALFDRIPGGSPETVVGGPTTVGVVGNPVGGKGLVMSGVSGDISFGNLNVNGTGTAFSVNASGGFDLRIVNGSASSSAGTGLDLENLNADAQFASVSSTSSPSEGMKLTNVTGVVNVSGGSITNAGGNGITISGGTANITYGGSVSGSAGHPVFVTGTTGGTKTFSGSISGSSNGVNLQTNTGATVAFTGMLSITTASNIAFRAEGGGTVTATGSASVLSTTSGVALNVTNTTIGAAGLKFRSVSAASAANGIVLNNTGSAGGLIVTGNAAAGSGGTIDNTTSHGISLTSTRAPSFSYMNVQNSGGSGVKGTSVDGFTFQNGTINNSGTGGGADDSNIAFNTNSGSSTDNNISGAVTISGNTLSNARYHGINILNFAGTLSNVNISNNTITSATSTAASLGTGVFIAVRGSAANVASISGGSIANNVISNFPAGAGIRVDSGNLVAAGPSNTVGTSGNPLSITGNTIRGVSSAVRMGTQAINVTVSGKSSGNVDVSGNGTNANPLTNMNGSAIAVSAFGQVSVTATVNNNVVVANNVLAAPAISLGAEQQFASTDAPVLNAVVTGNNVSGSSGSGIQAVARNSNGTMQIKIQNNTVAASTSGVRQGIRVDSGTAAGNTTVCLNISGNTSAGSGGATGIGLRKQGTLPATNAFGINGMAATATPAVEAYVNSLNPAGGGTQLISATSGFTSCPLP